MGKDTDLIGAEMVVNSLEELNPAVIFGIPGIHNLDIYDALLDSDLEHITARHEQGAGFMADGYARNTGQPGICLVISGPGLTNIITPMGQAMADSVPMVVISTQLPTSTVNYRAGNLHELKNSTYLAESVAKESKRVKRKENISSAIEDAYQLALSGRPGPVHVEIPVDILQAPVKEKSLVGSFDFCRNPWTGIDQESELEAAADLLTEEETVIIAGGGSIEAAAGLKKLAVGLEAPVVETIAGKGVVAEDHPLCLGASLKFPSVRNKIKEASCVLAVGTQLAATDLEGTELEINGTLIQIDVEPSNFNKNYPADISLRGTAREVVKEINSRLDLTNISSETDEKSNQPAYSKQELINHRGVEEEELDFTLQMINEVRNSISRDGVLVADMTSPAYVARSEYPTYQPQTFLHPVGYGTLGYALPAAVGVKLSAPGKEVVALAGDGGFQFTMQELGVLLEHELSLPIIIWNDGGFGEIRKNEEERHPGETIAVNHENPGLKQLAASYDLSFSRVSKPKELETSLKKALGKDTPEIIEIAVK